MTLLPTEDDTSQTLARPTDDQNGNAPFFYFQKQCFPQFDSFGVVVGGQCFKCQLLSNNRVAIVSPVLAASALTQSNQHSSLPQWGDSGWVGLKTQIFRPNFHEFHHHHHHHHHFLHHILLSSYNSPEQHVPLLNTNTNATNVDSSQTILIMEHKTEI